MIIHRNSPSNIWISLDNERMAVVGWPVDCQVILAWKLDYKMKTKVNPFFIIILIYQSYILKCHECINCHDILPLVSKSL